MLPPAGQKTGRDDVDLFFERLRQLHTEPYLCSTEKETGDTLRRLVGQARSVVIASLPTSVANMVRSSLVGISYIRVEELAVTEAVSSLAQAEIGITWARHGVVNQGALVEVVEDDAQKLASCLPQVHIALVSSGSLLPDLPAAMKEVGHIISSSPPERRPIISFISGPSKTGDIEMRLLYGVHGPLKLQVLLLDWA